MTTTNEAAAVSWELHEDFMYREEYDAESGDFVEVEESSGPYVLIQNVFVPANQRRQGVGRRIMLEAIAEIRAAHPGLPIRLWSEARGGAIDDESLGLFYESLGFTAIGDGFGGEGAGMEL